MELINIQVPPEGIAAPNNQTYDNEPVRGESGRALNSAPAAYPRKKAKPFIDDEDDADFNAAESEIASEAVEPELESDEVQPYEKLDEALAGVVAPEAIADREDDEAEAADSQDAESDNGEEAASSENALISARNRDGMAKLYQIALHRKKTEQIQKLVKGIRLNRAEASTILSFMHPFLIALGIWKYWCEEEVGIPVKTADAWRQAHDARQKLPPELLAAVNGIDVDISQPKVSNVLLSFGDEFYEGEVSETRIAEMMTLLKAAAKRAPAKSKSGPNAPIGTVHGSSGAAEDNGHDVTSVTEPLEHKPETKPEPKPKQVTFPGRQYEEIEAREEKLRPYLGTTNLPESVLAAFRRLEQMSLFESELIATVVNEATEEEVLVCE